MYRQDSIIKRGWEWDYFNPATRVNMLKVSTSIFNDICRGLFIMFNDLKWEMIVLWVDIDGVVDQCLQKLWAVMKGEGGLAL